MAEIQTAPNKLGKAGVRKTKKLSTKVDLTPMVDLGFLLITFFIITTKWSEAKVADIKMPADSRDSSKICESCALTVIPNGDGKIFYYHGNLENALSTGKFGTTNFDYKNGIGRIIRENQAALTQKGIARKDFMLLIKPTEEAAYSDVVDLFDEILINDVTRYAIINIQPEEKEFLKNKNL